MAPVAMAKNHQRGALGKARSKRLRATIGLFRDRLIAPQTLAKKQASTAAFFSFCSIAGYFKPHTATEMDLRLCEFVGGSRNIPADAPSGLIHFINALRGSSMAVSDYYWHGAKMSCQCELIPCRSIFCLPWSAIRSKRKNCESRCRFWSVFTIS